MPVVYYDTCGQDLRDFLNSHFKPCEIQQGIRAERYCEKLTKLSAKDCKAWALIWTW